MFDRWSSARLRQRCAALILGCTIVSTGVSASATVVLQPGAAEAPAKGIAHAATQQSPWSWLIIAVLIGLAPLAVERVYRKKTARRRYSRIDITLLETELGELRALDSRNRAILEPLDWLSDGIEITDAEGRQLFCNAKHREFFPKTGHLHVHGALQSDLVRAAAESGEIADAVGSEEEWIESVLGRIGPRKSTSRDVQLADGRTLMIRNFETQSGGSVLLRTDISDLKIAEREISSQEKLLGNVIANIPHLVFWKNRDLVYLGCNDSFARFAGVASPDELVGKTDFELAWDDDVTEAIHRIDRRIIETAEPVLDHEESRTGIDGVDMVLLSNRVALRDADGEVIGILGIHQDITARTATESALRESEQLFKTFMDNFPSAVLVKDLDGKMIFANKVWHERDNRDGLDIEGRTSDDFYSKDYAALIRGQDDETIKTRHSIAKEVDARLLDGSVVSRILQKFPIVGADSQIIGVGSISTDISALKETERALRESAARLQSLTSNVPGVVYQRVLGPDGTVSLTFVSDGVFDLTGFRPAEAMADPSLFTDLVHPDDRARFYETIEASKASLEPFEVDLRIVSRDGAQKWVRGISRPCRADDGAIVWDSLMFDISNSKLVEQSLADAKDAAEVASWSKTEFLTNMSHEIRTPMNGVLGMASLLLDSDLTDQQRTNVQTIRSSGASLLSLLNDILDISKMEAGKLEVEQIEFDLAEVVESISPLLAPAFREKDIDLCCYVAPDVPRYVRGDPGRLRQILLNLVGNALKFTSTGAVDVQIRRVDDLEVGMVLRFDIVDTGVGIPEDVQTRLFGKFSQADSSTSRNYGGTGLGLAISKELCELMGGKIAVESVPGQGSCFSFTVQFDRADVGGAYFGAPPVARRVLIVEPREHVRRAVARQFRSWGMEVHDFPDPDAARAALGVRDGIGETFDAALIAGSFAGTDGAAFAIELAQLHGWQQARFILLSSSDVHHSDPPGGRQVFQAHLARPIVPSDLRRCLDDPGDVAPIADDEVRDRAASTPSSGAAGGQRLRILLAEDNVVNQTVARAFLLRAGHLVDIVENGEEAIKAVQRTAYDVVLMDIQMPGMDGIAATRAIRQLDGPAAKVPIIALTANAMVGDEEKYLSMGANGYVSKPIEPVELFGAIGLCCGTDLDPMLSEAPLDAIPRPDVTLEVAEEAANLMGSLDDLMDGTD